MYKLKTEAVTDNVISVSFPAEVLANFGISAGDEIDVTETDTALILRSVDEAKRSREIADATENVFNRWDKVFVELAKGADEK